MPDIEIASAYVSITTKMPGVKKDIEDAVGEADTDGAGKKAGSKFSAGFAGAIGGAAAAVTTQLLSGLSDLTGQMFEASDATDKFKSTLSFAGLPTGQIQSLTDAAQDYADKTVYSLGDIQNVTAQLAANSVPDFDKLAEAAGNLNAVAGGNADTFRSVGMVLTQTAGQGKLTTENWNQLADAIPGASGKLQDALLQAGAFTGNFRDAMEKGEITADEFNAAVLAIGDQPIAEQAATSTATFEGSVGNLQASIVSVGKDLLDRFKPAITQVMGTLSDAATGFGQFFDWLMENKPLLIVLASVIGVGLVVAFGAWVASIWATLPALYAQAAATWAANAALLASPITWIVVAIIALIAVIILLATNWDTVTKFVTDVWNGFIGWITGIIGAFASWWNSIWDGITGFLSDAWNNVVGFVQAVFWGYVSWLMSIGNSISSWWNGLWDGIGQTFQDVWNNIVSFFKGIANGYLGMLERFVNGAIDIINGITGGINFATGLIGIPSIPAIGHVTFPQLAQGAYITAHPGGILANIGEGNYDEVVQPTSGPKFDDFTGKIAAKLGGSSGGLAMTVNVLPEQDPRIVGRQLGREFLRTMAGAVA